MSIICAVRKQIYFAREKNVVCFFEYLQGRKKRRVHQVNLCLEQNFIVFFFCETKTIVYCIHYSCCVFFACEKKTIVSKSRAKKRGKTKPPIPKKEPPFSKKEAPFSKKEAGSSTEEACFHKGKDAGCEEQLPAFFLKTISSLILFILKYNMKIITILRFHP